MSKFLDAKIGVRIPSSQARTVTRDQFKTWLEAAGWRTIHTEDTTPSLTVIPPATEEIGNARGKEAVRLNFTSTTIEFRPVYQTNEASRRSYYITAGTTAASVKIGTQTITGANSGTANANTTNLLNALTASQTPEALAYTFTSGSVGSVTYIVATENAVGGGLDIVVASGANVYQRTARVAVNEVVNRNPYMNSNAFKVTVDTGQGYAVYFGIFARSLTLATRTLAGFYGPTCASYFSRASALAQCPEGCALSELAFANPGVTAGIDTRFAVRFGLVYGFGSSTGVNNYDNGSAVRPLENYLPDTFSPPYPTTFVSRDSTEPVALGYAGGLDAANGLITAIFGTGGITSGSLLVPGAAGRSSSSSYNFATWTPAAALEDVTVFLTNETSETEHSIRTSTFSPLSAALDASSTTLTVADASAFPASGTLAIDSEVLTYTSKNGNTLQGVTRAVNSTGAAPHAVNTPVYVGFWWLKINQGGVPTGYLPVGA